MIGNVTLLILCLVALTGGKQSVDYEKSIVGAWGCSSGPCIDPEIAFEVEDGARVFRSWLHHRPSMIGKWSVSGSTVTIAMAGLENTYKIDRVNKKVLILREEGDEEPARYKRIP